MEIVIKNEQRTPYRRGDLFRWTGDNKTIVQIVQVSNLEYMFIALNSADRWDDETFQITAIPQSKLTDLTFIGRPDAITIEL